MVPSLVDLSRTFRGGERVDLKAAKKVAAGGNITDTAGKYQ